MTITSHCDLSEFRGVFADGWTDDRIESVLPCIEAELGVPVRCVWEYVDEFGFGGHSNLICLADGEPRELPDGMWALLVDGEGDGRIDPSTVGSSRHPDLPAGIDVGDLHADSSGFNLAFQARCA